MEGRSRRKKKHKKRDATAQDAGPMPSNKPSAVKCKFCARQLNSLSNKKALQHPTKPSTHPPSTKLPSTCEAHHSRPDIIHVGEAHPSAEDSYVLGFAQGISDSTDNLIDV